MLGQLWDGYWALLVTIWGSGMNVPGLRTFLAMATPVLALAAFAAVMTVGRYIGRQFMTGYRRGLAKDEPHTPA